MAALVENEGDLSTSSNKKDIIVEEEELEEEGLKGLFGGSDSESEEDETEIKYDTYRRPSNNEELTLALVKRHHSLWGEFIYNAARVISDYVDAGRIAGLSMSGVSVLELGAGAGLPGIVCALNGAKTVVLSDYGSEFDRVLVEAMDLNIASFASAAPNCKMFSVPYIWGKDVDVLCTEPMGKGNLFGVVIMADCIFNRSEHRQLLWTLCHTMSREGICLCTFSHHDPQYREQDLNFLKLADEAGLMCTCIGVEKHQSFPFVENDGLDDQRGFVYFYTIRWKRPEKAED